MIVQIEVKGRFNVYQVKWVRMGYSYSVPTVFEPKTPTFWNKLWGDVQYKKVYKGGASDRSYAEQHMTPSEAVTKATALVDQYEKHKNSWDTFHQQTCLEKL